jgi:hypothetical protein
MHKQLKLVVSGCTIYIYIYNTHRLTECMVRMLHKFVTHENYFKCQLQHYTFLCSSAKSRARIVGARLSPVAPVLDKALSKCWFHSHHHGRTAAGMWYLLSGRLCGAPRSLRPVSARIRMMCCQETRLVLALAVANYATLKTLH